MSGSMIFGVIGAYFLLLFLISWRTGRKADEATFFKGNRSSPWYLVAFGMIGASLSGVTFISVPGWVGSSQFSYMQMVLGYLLGYAVIAFVLMPLYYRLNLTSIYGYLEQRFGPKAYKTGAVFFLISRVIGASFRLFLVALVFDLVFDMLDWNVPFVATVAISIALIWIYTFRGGIKTVVWTDTLQTAAMLLAAGITVYVIMGEFDWTLGEMAGEVRNSSFSEWFFGDASHPKAFWKQFLSGAFIAIVMTGLDQDMMQKNLTCRSLRDAQKNVASFSIVLVFVNLVFLTLGALLFMYGTQQGIFTQELDPSGMVTGKVIFAAEHIGGGIPEGAVPSDKIFPILALKFLPAGVGMLFILGLIAAAYSSADSALTALTTSFCIDILNFEKDTQRSESERRQLRNWVHLGFSVVLFAVILVFYLMNDQSVISSIFQAAGYTYGPLLGLYAFGLFTRLSVPDNAIPFICLASPILSYGLQVWSDGWFGFFILVANGALTFLGLLLASQLHSRPETVRE